MCAGVCLLVAFNYSYFIVSNNTVITIIKTLFYIFFHLGYADIFMICF